MPRKVVIYKGKVYEDPRGYNYDPHSSWDNDPLLDQKPWRDLALYWKYLIHLAVWEWEGREVWLKGDPVARLVKRGQIYQTLERLGEKPGWSKSRVWRTLRMFERDGRAVTESGPHGTLVTIVNYDPYQDPGFYRETPKGVNFDKGSKKRNGVWNAAKSRTGSEDTPSQEGVSETESGTVTERTRNANRYKTLKTLNLGGRVREIGDTPAGAPGDPEVCSWDTIVRAFTNHFWQSIPHEVRARLLREASSTGPLPDSLEARLREEITSEARRLSISYCEQARLEFPVETPA